MSTLRADPLDPPFLTLTSVCVSLSQVISDRPRRRALSRWYRRATRATQERPRGATSSTSAQEWMACCWSRGRVAPVCRSHRRTCNRCRWERSTGLAPHPLGRASRARSGLAVGSPPLPPPPSLPVDVAQRRGATRPGGRVGRAQRRGPSAGLRQVCRRGRPDLVDPHRGGAPMSARRSPGLPRPRTSFHIPSNQPQRPAYGRTQPDTAEEPLIREVPGQRLVLWVWQVKDSNLRRHKPTDLQSAPIGRSGNLPW